MKIVITCIHFEVANNGGGGSDKYFQTIARTLTYLGHSVYYIENFENFNPKNYDCIISSHQHQLEKIRDFNIPILHICHGKYIKQELPIEGASHYFSVSDEVKRTMLEMGFESEVIGQPIFFKKYKEVEKTNKILFIKNNASRDTDWTHPNIVKSDRNRSIEQQILESSLCISLGRGAVESMSLGVPVIVADNRFSSGGFHNGLFGDGYVNEENYNEIKLNNFSGRRYQHHATDEWLNNEIDKYKKEDGKWLRFKTYQDNNAITILEKMLRYV